MQYQFYSGQGIANATRFDVARLLLCLFGEQQVRDIIALVNLRGQGLIDDIYGNSTEADPPHIFGVLGAPFMKPHDAPGPLLGLATTVVHTLRKPKMGNDEYQEILQGAFGLPSAFAKVYADKIETYDEIVANANGDDKTQLMERVTQLSNLLQEGARRVINGLSTAAGLNTLINWDQNQTYDFDLLFELASLGKAVAELNQRSRYMGAQALVSAQMNLLQTGDVDSLSNDPVGEQMGDLLSTAAQRQLPKEIMGNVAGLSNQGHKATLKAAEALLGAGNMSVNPSSKSLVTGDPDSSIAERIQLALGKILQGNPLSSSLLGALKGTGGNKKTRLASKITSAEDASISAGESGDPNLYGDIADEYGDGIANAWAAGDIDAVAKECFKMADEVGDLTNSEIDAISSMLPPTHAGDIEDMSPETGGLFTKLRTRLATKKAARRKARAGRKANRVRNRLNRKQKLAAAKEAARADYFPAADDLGPDEELYEQPTAATEGFSDDYAPVQDERFDPGFFL